MPPVKFVDHIRGVLSGPLCRHEARMAGRPRAMAVYYGLSLFFDAAALAGLAMTVSGYGRDAGADAAVFLGTAALVTLTGVAAATGLMIPAIAGERANGTLEAMLLTSVSRRALLWAKLMGRTYPVRRMLVASFPAFLWCGVALFMKMGLGSEDDVISWGRLAVLGAIGGTMALGWWAAVLLASHCAAAGALYFSGRARGPLTATLGAGLGVLAPPLVLGCCYGVGVVYVFVAGPVFFSELIRNLDRFTIEGC
jgi:hypothetical protein